MAFILALDQGTTSSRAILFDHAGAIRASAQKEFTQLFPQAGWVEHDPLEIWSSQIEVARAALASARLTAGDVAAIGITNQRETAIIWDRRSGEPIHNAIVWQDRRTAAFCDDLKRAGHGDLITRKTGLVIDAYFSASKIRWLLDHVPGARERARHGELAFGTVDTWLLWKLTGGALHLTDPSNASRTLVFNLHTGAWDEELLRLLDVPRELLPEVRSSSEVYGETVPGLLGASVPIAGMAGDQQAALFGQSCFSRGLAKNTYGTGCFMLMNTGTQPVASRHQLLTTVAWRVGAQTDYALEGSVFIGGAVVQWLRDGLGLIKSSAEVEALAASVPDCGGVYLVPAFAGLGAPHWDQYARGTITGLTRGTTAGHIARAALEGIAFQVADLLEVMKRDSGIPISELRVDGGAAANNLLMQFQADLLQVPVVRPKVAETTALGAACLAGLAVGFWKDRAEASRAWQPDRTFEPAKSKDEVAHRRSRWAEALNRAREWEQHHSIRLGKVIVKVKLTSLKDLFLKGAGARRTRPRQVEVEALVDAGATRLYLKPSVIEKLGLQRVDAVRSRTTNSEAIRFKYEPVQLELMGRKENFDVIEVPESVPNLLGQVPLEVLDLVVDPKGQKLIPNAAHGGEQMTEEY